MVRKLKHFQAISHFHPFYLGCLLVAWKVSNNNLYFFISLIELLVSRMLLDGEGISHNPNAHVEAATLFLTAAEQGRIPQAEYYLALMYEYGEKSFDRALQYYQRVAQQNH